MAKNEIDLDIDCNSAIISHSKTKIIVTVEGADYTEILDNIGMDAAIGHFGETEILNAIDKSTVMAHFGLEL